jgi:uncharacterized lipoprotein YbaY/membrane-bound inhibitor of C-type lysozyme
MRRVWPRLQAAVLGSSLMLVPAILAQEPTAAPAPKPKSAMRRVIEWKHLEYTCEGGQKLAVQLHEETVKVSFKERDYLMKQVRAADGARYSDGKVVWWSKGDGGFLQMDSQDGDGEMIVKDCKLDEPVGANTITGTVSYLVRIALPPEAIIQVQLQDISLADAPAKVVAEERITLGQRQVPIPFTLKYDPAKIDPQHAYSIRANILMEKQLRFTSDQTYGVLTGGNPSRADVNVKPLASVTPIPQ